MRLSSVAGMLAIPLAHVQCPGFLPSKRHSHVYSRDGQVITRDLVTFIQGLMAAQNVTGLTMAVVRPDGGVELGGWGNATENGDPVGPDTLFNIGSCTKAFTATSLGIVIDVIANEKNKTRLPRKLTTLDWASKVGQLLPNDWKLVDKYASDNTNLRDLLSHMTGLIGHDLAYSGNETEQAVARNLRNLQTPLEFREEFSYNNQMYITAADLLHSLSGEVYSDLVENRIFLPLGMSATTLVTARAQASGKFSQAFDINGRRIPYWFAETPVINGAGGIISSVRDMTKWLQVLLNSGVDPNSKKTVIPASTFTAMTTASSVVLGTAVADVLSVVGYGLGWARASYRGHDLLFHGGSAPGFKSSLLFLPTAKLGIVILTNSDGGTTVSSLAAFQTIDVALGLPPLNLSSILAAPGSSSGLVQRSIPIVDPPPSVNLSDYAGHYSNPGYGSFTLCPRTNASSRKNDECAPLIANFSLVPSAIDPNVTAQLVASYPRLWASQLRFTLNGTDKFSLDATTLFPDGFGANTAPFEWPFITGALATFVRDQGKSAPVKGFFACGISGAPDEVGDTCFTDEVNQAGLVWFDKD